MFQPTIEAMWAIKTAEHARIYFDVRYIFACTYLIKAISDLGFAIYRLMLACRINDDNV